MTEKLCLYCEHCDLTIAEPNWSAWTLGDNFGLWCAKRHWVFYAYDTSRLSMAKVLQTALTCPDYVLSIEAKEIIQT